METRGFQETLTYCLRQDNSTLVRSQAAKLLLAATKTGNRNLPSTPGLLAALESAVACGAEVALDKHSSQHGAHALSLAQAQSWCQSGAALQQRFEDVAHKAAALQAEAENWKMELLTAAQQKAASAEAASAASQASLQEQRQRLIGLTQANGHASALKEVATDELELDLVELQASLASRESELAVHEKLLQETLEQRMGLTTQLAERDQAARHWESSAAAAEASFAEATVQNAMSTSLRTDSSEAAAAVTNAAQKSAECRAKYDAALRGMEELRTEVTEQDERLRAVSAPLPAWRASIAEDRQRLEEMSAERDERVSAWRAIQEAQDICGARSKVFLKELRSTGSLLKQEAARRRQLRTSLQALTASLQTLDSQLEALEDLDESVVNSGSLLFSEC